MKQEIYADKHEPQDWDMEHSSSCFVHLCDALLWREITGENPPQTPVTAREYERAGLPWFDYYRDDLAVLEGSKTLAIAVVFLIAGGIFPSKVLHWREEAAHSIEQALGLHHESAQ